jgi:hypothetical protein
MIRKLVVRLWSVVLDGFVSLVSMIDLLEIQWLREILEEEIMLIEEYSVMVQRFVNTEKPETGKAATGRGRALRVQFGEMEIVLIGDFSDESWLSEQVERKAPRRFFLRRLTESINGELGVFEVREVQPAPTDAFDTNVGDALIIGARPSEAEPALSSGIGVVFDVDQIIHFDQPSGP